jgi:hypothetical protein
MWDLGAAPNFTGFDRTQAGAEVDLAGQGGWGDSFLCNETAENGTGPTQLTFYSAYYPIGNSQLAACQSGANKLMPTTRISRASTLHIDRQAAGSVLSPSSTPD